MGFFIMIYWKNPITKSIGRTSLITPKNSTTRLYIPKRFAIFVVSTTWFTTSAVEPKLYTIIPKTWTNIIGVSEAKAIKPKPSIAGFLPLIDELKPIPRAATRGTVTVEVVTPPLS